MKSEQNIAHSRINVLQGYSTKIDVNEAVQELAAQIRQPKSKMCLVFFSDEYDRQQLGRAIQKHLPDPVIGCSTAGQLSSLGYQSNGISGATFASDEIIAEGRLGSDHTEALDILLFLN